MSVAAFSSSVRFRQAVLFNRKAIVSAIALSVTALANAQGEGRLTLEEIIVSAQKTEQNIQDTPIAISAFNEDSMLDMGIQSSTDLQVFTPGMHVTRSRITIRGIGREQTQLGSDPGIGIYYDNVYSFDRRILTTTDFWDVERVEVLRGPQGTLFGRNTIGGAINVASRAPTFDFEGAAEVEVGDYGTQNMKVALGGPLTDSVQARVSLFDLQRDGYQENINDSRTFDDRDTQGGQLSLNVEWNEDWVTAFRARGTTSDFAPPASKIAGEYNTADPYFGNGSHNPNFNRTTVNPFIADDSKADINPESPMSRRLDDYTVSMDNLWYVDAGEIKYIASYGQSRFHAKLDVDGSGSDAYSNVIERTDTESEIQTHELQFVSDWDGDFNINTGLYYYNEKTSSEYGFYDTVDERYNRPVDQIAAGWADGVGLGAVCTAFYGADCTTTAGSPLAGVSIDVLNAALAADSQVPAYLGDPKGINSTYWTDTELEATSYAAFGQVDWDYSDDLNLTFGLRYSYDEKDGVETTFAYTETVAGLADIPTVWVAPELANPVAGETGGRAVNYAYLQNGFSAGNGVFGFPVAGGVQGEGVSDDWSSVDGKVSFDYALDIEQMIYGSISTGYRSGGFALGSNFSGSIPTVDPEKLVAYELGYKGELADGRVRVNTSLYFYDYTDMQLRNNVLGEGGQVLPVLSNAGSAETYGLDLEASWLVSESLKLDATYSYMNAEFTDYKSVDTFLSGSDPLSGVEQDLSGNKLNRSPEHKYSLLATYTVFTGLGDVDFIGSYSWTDEMFHSQFNTEADKTPDFKRVDARVRWTSIDAVWGVTAYVDNVTDDRTPQSNFVDAPSTGGNTFLGLPKPRTYGVKVRYNF